MSVRPKSVGGVHRRPHRPDQERRDSRTREEDTHSQLRQIGRSCPHRATNIGQRGEHDVESNGTEAHKGGDKQDEVASSQNS